MYIHHCFCPLNVNQKALLGIIPRQNQQMALLNHTIYKYVLYLYFFFWTLVSWHENVFKCMSLARFIILFKPFWAYTDGEWSSVEFIRMPWLHSICEQHYFLRKARCKIKERNQLAVWLILTLKEGNYSGDKLFSVLEWLISRVSPGHRGVDWGCVSGSLGMLTASTPDLLVVEETIAARSGWFPFRVNLFNKLPVWFHCHNRDY